MTKINVKACAKIGTTLFYLRISRGEGFKLLRGERGFKQRKQTRVKLLDDKTENVSLTFSELLRPLQRCSCRGHILQNAHFEQLSRDIGG